MFEKKLVIRSLEICPPVVLAPMVGLSHSAMRTLVQEEGGCGMFFTEMLSAKRLPHDNPAFSPLLVRDKNEGPLIYQIFLSSDEQVAPAVDKLHQLSADGIDINMGCPAPSLKKQGAGLSLVDNQELLAKIVRNIRQRTDLPVSVKIRLGSSGDSEKLLLFCRLLEDLGIDFITIHARLNGDKFCRRPRWSIIAGIKKVISIPIIANGGIFSLDDAKRCLLLSGADGLMIGRGAVIRPWLPAEISSEIYGEGLGNAPTSRPEIYSKFCELLVKRFDVERRIGRLKQFTHLFASSYQFGHLLATSVQNSVTLEEAQQKANDFFANQHG